MTVPAESTICWAREMHSSRLASKPLCDSSGVAEQAEARDAAKKLHDSERQLAETRAEAQASRARLEADMAALKASPRTSGSKSRLRSTHHPVIWAVPTAGYA